MAPRLLRVFATARSDDRLPPFIIEAQVLLIPKVCVCGGARLCDSYCPISLIKLHTKILAKIIAGWLQMALPKLVNADQMGFIPGRVLFLNLQAKKHDDNSGTQVVASLEWPYLFWLLESYGFGPVFISWVKLLYTEPLVRLQVNGIISEPFPIFRGTRHGCPLSPLPEI